MEISAQLKHLRQSPRKIRLVAGAIRGLSLFDAEAHLALLRKDAAMPLAKLLKSVTANAAREHHLDRKNLYVKQILVDEGATLKRFRPRAYGRATPIRKRSSSITMILDERAPTAEVAPEDKRATLPPPVLVAERPSEARLGTDRASEKEKRIERTAKELETTEEHKPESHDLRRVASPRHRKIEGGPSRGFLRRLFQRKSG